jgi:hypothetical protein
MNTEEWDAQTHAKLGMLGMKWDGSRGEGNPIGWWGHLVTEKTTRTLMCQTGGVDKGTREL